MAGSSCVSGAIVVRGRHVFERDAGVLPPALGAGEHKPHHDRHEEDHEEDE